jgi:hypothetical protein
VALPPLSATSTTGGASLAVVDFRSDYLSAGPAESDYATLTATFDPVPAGYLWLVQRITVLTDSTTPTQATVYAGYPSPQNFVDGTERGNLDTADESSPILIDSSVSLAVVWTGASLGSTAHARIQYQLVQRA